jgi:hypothetical protein
MSLRQEILKQIKVMLNEAEMSEMPPGKTLNKCPPGKIQSGESVDGPICREPTAAEKQGMEWGQKITDFTDNSYVFRIQ